MYQLFLLALAAVAAAPRREAHRQTPSPQQQADLPAPPQQSEPPAADPADVASPEKVVAALYETISGPAGRRDWDRLRSLFIPGGRLMPTGPRLPPGTPADSPPAGAEEFATQVLDVEGYVERAGRYFEEHGFFEREVARRAEGFGHIMHVFSTYESRHEEDDPEPFARGINSIQLVNDGRRWWVVSIFWESESPQTPIPREYLPGEPDGAGKSVAETAGDAGGKTARKGARKGARKSARKSAG